MQLVQDDVLGRGEGGFSSVSQPRGLSCGSSSETIWLRVLLRASETEYGSVTTLVSTCWCGDEDLYLVEVVLADASPAPVKLHTPLAGSSVMG